MKYIFGVVKVYESLINKNKIITKEMLTNNRLILLDEAVFSIGITENTVKEDEVIITDCNFYSDEKSFFSIHNVCFYCDNSNGIKYFCNIVKDKDKYREWYSNWILEKNEIKNLHYMFVTQEYYTEKLYKKLINYLSKKKHDKYWKFNYYEAEQKKFCIKIDEPKFLSNETGTLIIVKKDGEYVLINLLNGDINCLGVENVYPISDRYDFYNNEDLSKITYKTKNAKIYYDVNEQSFTNIKIGNRKFKSEIIEFDSIVYFYFSKTKDDLASLVFLKFAQENLNIMRLDNLFDDDISENYVVKFDKNSDIYDFALCFYRFMLICKNINNNLLIYGYEYINLCNPLGQVDIESKIVDMLMDKYRCNDMKNIDVLVEQKYNYQSIFLDFSEIYNFIKKNVSTDYTDEECRFYYDGFKVEVKKTKWISEAYLYKVVLNEYKDALFQYKPKWLMGLTLDIFIPSLNIGIEYQGKQHYKQLEFFGGAERLEQQKKRDDLKKQLCINNHVILIDWAYYETISLISLKEKIKKFREIG